VAYRADIEIAVRGAQELKRLQNEVSATSKLVDGLNKYLENIGSGGVVRNINNLKDAVGNAALVFNKAALGTDEATIAAKKYITATTQLNAGLRERAELLKQITEQERKAKLAAAGIRETTQYGGPIGPGQASPVALSSQLRGRTEQILAEREGRAELNTILQNQFEKERQLANSKLDAQAAKVQTALEAQAHAAAESASQTQKLSDRQQEFTQRTEAAARAAKAQTAEFVRQQRLQLQLLRGTSGTVELGPGGLGFSGGYTASQRTQANQQAILKSKVQENAARRETLQLVTREELFELRLNKLLERNAAAVQKRTDARRQTREAASNAIIGGAFPLLFGQGLGAAVGGGAGGALGGALGGSLGFGLSLVGTAIGAAFDNAANSSRDFAKALRGNGDAAQVLETLLGGLDSETKTLITNLQSSGQVAKAADVAFKELSKTIGSENAKAIQDAGNGWDNFGKQVKTTLTDITANVIRTFKEIEKQYPGQGGLVSFIGNLALQGEKRAAPAALTPEAAQRVKTLQQETDQLRTQASLGTLSAKNNLDLFVYTSQRLAQQERINRESEIEYKFTQGQISAKERLLLLDKSRVQTQVALNNIERERIQEIQRRQEEAARAAKQAAEEAARAAEQTLKARLTLERDLYEQERKGIELRVRSVEFYQGTEAGLTKQQELLEYNYTLQTKALDVERQQAIEEARKTGTAQQVLELYDIRLAQLNTEMNLEGDILARKIKQLQLSEQQARIDKQRAQANTLRGVSETSQRLRVENTFMPDSAQLREQLFLLEQSVRVYSELRPEQEKLRDLQREIQSGAFDEKTLQIKQQEFNTQQKFVQQLGQELSLRTALEQRQFRLNELYKQYGFISTEVSNALTSSITGLITGTQTVSEAFSTMFENIGKAFIDMATQMLAQKLIFTIFQSMAGAIPGGGAGLEPATPGGNASFMDRVFSTPLAGAGYAEGGFVTGPTRAMIGEGGQPEYVIPASKMRGAMQRYAGGARGAAVIPSSGQATGADGGIAAVGPIDVRYSVERINSVDYVTADQFQRGMQQAASQGATRGEQAALRRLQQSSSTRRRIGI
jgi:hypothetical protein